jgi:hypothetical protein
MLSDAELLAEIQQLTLDYLKQEIDRDELADLLIGLLEDNGRRFIVSATVAANDG